MFRTSVYGLIVIIVLAAPSLEIVGPYGNGTKGEANLSPLPKRVLIIDLANNGREIIPDRISILGCQNESAAMGDRRFAGKWVHPDTFTQENRFASAEFVPYFSAGITADIDIRGVLYANKEPNDNRRHFSNVLDLDRGLDSRRTDRFAIFELSQGIFRFVDIWTANFNAKPWFEAGFKLTNGERFGGIRGIDGSGISGSGDLYCLKGSVGTSFGFLELLVKPVSFGSGPRLLVFDDFMGSDRRALGGEGSPASEDQANNKRGEFERSDSNRYSGQPVAFLDGLHSRPLRAQISVIPILWVIAIGMIGFGSYRGFFGEGRWDTVSGWLVFVLGIALQLGIIELLISGVT
ncbi:hypothetical protein [Mesorhizobium sp.]|uniref:hypothetical protein n=1 Tax=Mesorhizobium sp. TaxID=1871066 RepID=UPI00121625D1|nr:hypothetical protein [Mesorhizobium sp.]TIM05824.1 MAG: hypothetical protein E5Y62_26440 [Mesorhizobium sp.]